jgi:hypothetical protein
MGIVLSHITGKLEGQSGNNVALLISGLAAKSLLIQLRLKLKHRASSFLFHVI